MCPQTLGSASVEIIDKVYRDFMENRMRSPATVSYRAREAISDYLSTIPGAIFRPMKNDIAAVWHMLESPIEQIALIQLASCNYRPEHQTPVYPKVCAERGKYLYSEHPVQITPQVQFGRYRVDFFIDCGERFRVAIECDGREYHQDKVRDQRRDEYLKAEYGLDVARIPGHKIWYDNRYIAGIAESISVFFDDRLIR